MTDSISVVIPTYNGRAFLEETLASVTAQTLPPKEIIVVDDASTDGTPDVVCGLARRALVPIRVIRRKLNSGGPAHPLNVGIRAARHEVIAVLEQDDLMTPSRLRSQLSAMERHPNGGLFIGRYDLFGAAPSDDVDAFYFRPQFDVLGWNKDDPRWEKPYIVLEAPVAFKALLSFNFTISNSTFCFRKKLWERLGGFDGTIRVCPDWDFALRASLHAPIVVINEIILRYRWRANSLIRQSLPQCVQDSLRTVAKIAHLKQTWISDELWSNLWNWGRSVMRDANQLEAAGIAWELVRSGAFRKRLRSKLEEWKASLHGRTKPATISMNRCADGHAKVCGNSRPED